MWKGWHEPGYWIHIELSKQSCESAVHHFLQIQSLLPSLPSPLLPSLISSLCSHLSSLFFLSPLVSPSTLLPLLPLHPPLPSPPPSPIHTCSAGVGRSGTFIALDYCMDRLADDKATARIIEVHGLVQMLRLQRPFMVQTEVSRSIYCTICVA